MANRPTTTLAEVADATEQGIQRVCKNDSLVVGFLAHTGLTLDSWTVNPTHETQKIGGVDQLTAQPEQDQEAIERAKQNMRDRIWA